MKLINIIFLLTLLFPMASYGAIGGTGSICDPSVAGWPSCTKTPVPWEGSVTNNIPIPAGTLSSPFSANSANTKYTLQGNVVANGRGINIGASYVTIDLNGYTLTYNQTTQGEGVFINTNNVHHIAIINGSIVQGAANSSGSTGAGSNPVSNVNLSGSQTTVISHFFMANVYTKRTGYDVGGVLVPSLSSVGSQVIDSTQEDGYTIGTLANRHTNLCAAFKVGADSSGVLFERVTIKNARHRGIEAGDRMTDTGTPTIVRNSKIELNSLDTNAGGVFAWVGKNIRVYNNEFILKGNHPIGITFMGQDTLNDNLWAYNNWIHGQRTAMCGDTSGDTATGIRFGSYQDSVDRYDRTKVFNNLIEIQTNAAYAGTNCATGAPASVPAKGKGIFFSAKSPSKAVIADNTIKITGTTGEGDGMSPMVGTEDDLYIINNRIEATQRNISIADSYAQLAGYPLFLNNTLVKTGSRSDYHTFNAFDWWGYQGTYQVRFVGTTYEGGASADNYYFDTSGTSTMNVYFGRMNGSSIVYDYQLTRSGTNVARTNYSPSISLSYGVPTTCSDWSKLCTTSTDCSTNWPGYVWDSSTGTCAPEGAVVTQTCYPDADGDLYPGNGSVSATTCPVGYYNQTHFTSMTIDCNDSNASINPGATEINGNGIDENCDGSDGSVTTITCYKDTDNDKYGVGLSEVTTSCSTGYYVASHFTSIIGDCNDNALAINPGVTEVCGNSIDDNCNGSVDEGCSVSGHVTLKTGGARLKTGGARWK